MRGGAPSALGKIAACHAGFGMPGHLTGTPSAQSKIRNCTVVGNSLWSNWLQWWRLHHSVIDLTSFMIWSESFHLV